MGFYDEAGAVVAFGKELAIMAWIWRHEIVSL